MGFSRQEYWSGLPFPSPGDLPNLGIKSGSPALEAEALPSEPPGKQTTNKTKMQTQSSADRITTSLSLARQRKNKLSLKKKKKKAQISPYTKLTQTTGPILGEKKPQGRKYSTLKPGKMRPQTQ